MCQSSDQVLLGKISGVHGIKGWVKVFSYTSPRLKITEYSEWLLKSKDQTWKLFQLIDGKKQGKNIVALLEGVNHRDQAEALVGMEIAIHSDQLKVLDDNEFFWRDLIGLSVETINGVKLGKVDWLFDTGSNDVIVVKDETDGKKTERLLPFLMDDVIKSVDLSNSLIIVDWDSEF
jgi:16S rRNA processing protein RimM